MNRKALDVIYSRRATRSFTAKLISEEILWQILEAARWAPTAFNRRIHRFVCLTEARLIRQLQLVSPGMGEQPTALIVICVDWNLLGYGVRVAQQTVYHNPYIDVGTAAENMLLVIHALGLGGWPMTSFSKDAVEVLLNLPPGLRPEMMIGLGYPELTRMQKSVRPKRRVRVEDLVQWGAFAT